MPTITPAAADPLQLTTERVTIPGDGTRTTETYNGPVLELEATESALLGSDALSGEIESLTLNHSAGRGSLRVARRRLIGVLDPQENVMQELFENIEQRSIFLAPYFASPEVADEEAVQVRNAWENGLTLAQAVELWTGTWTLKMKQLLGHLNVGQDTYKSHSYELMLTFRAASNTQLKLASSTPNTVQTLPTLSGRLQNLIDDLPAGEWLKGCSVVQSVGRGRMSVRLSYHWAKEWSIVYGGSFTGYTAP